MRNTSFYAGVGVEPVVDQQDESRQIVGVEGHGRLQSLGLWNHHPSDITIIYINYISNYEQICTINKFYFLSFSCKI